jgi:SRSO17 transposase
LLIRRRVDDPSQKTYYFVFAPQGTILPEMVKAIGARWHIEENFENGKDLGMDHYEVRSFIGWYRHITLVLLALAYLVGIWQQLVVPLFILLPLSLFPDPLHFL